MFELFSFYFSLIINKMHFQKVIHLKGYVKKIEFYKIVLFLYYQKIYSKFSILL